MEVRLRERPTTARLPIGFAWLPWNDVWLYPHAQTKVRAFDGEIDLRIFPALRDIDGCLGLMQAIRRNSGFCPEATWLIASTDGFAGTIQGIRIRGGVGLIQNVGIVPEARGLGLGKALVRQTLAGFFTAGVRTVRLEVTADNQRAVRLYEGIGFRRTTTSYRPFVD